MERYQLILAYDGTLFSGYQRQGKQRTVQLVLEEALKQLDWQERSTLCAGRTDTGVHASGQVVSFALEWNHSTDDLRNALNARLPEDMAYLKWKQRLRISIPDLMRFHGHTNTISTSHRRGTR